MNVIELALIAQDHMNKNRIYAKGVRFAMKTLPKSYNGTKAELAMYLAERIERTICNMSHDEDHELYYGQIALLNQMIKECL